MTRYIPICLLQIYTLHVSTRILHVPSFSNFYPLILNFVLLVRKPLSEAEGSARTFEFNENEEDLSEDEEEVYDEGDDTVISGSVYDTTETGTETETETEEENHGKVKR